MPDISILLKAVDKASPVINNTTKAVDNLGKEIKDTDKQTAKYNSTQNKSNKASQSMTKSFTAAGLAVAAITKGIKLAADGIKDSIEKYKAQEEVEAKLNQTLKSTGYAAGLSSQALKDMASNLQGMTTYGDEAILSGQSLLLTFKEIKGETFERTTETMLDLSAAMGQDLKASAVQLGKALNDPKTGITTLSRVGVSFTEEQKKMIATMQEAGDVAGAQAVILDELQSEFGGVAKAVGDTFSGSMQKARNNLGDLQEDLGSLAAAIGTGLLKELNSGILDVREFFKEITGTETAQNAIASMAAGFTVLFNVIKELTLGPTKELIQTFMEIGEEFAELTGGTGDLNIIMVSLAGSLASVMTITRSVLFVFKTLVNLIITLGKTVKEFAGFFKDSFDSVLNIAKTAWSAIKGELTFKEAFEKIKNEEIPALSKDFKNMGQDMGAAWKDFGQDVADDAVDFAKKTKNAYLGITDASEELGEKAAETYSTVRTNLEATTEDVGDLVNAQKKLTTSNNDVVQSNEEVDKSYDARKKASEEWIESIESEKEAADSLKDKITNVYNTIASTISSTISQVSDIVNTFYETAAANLEESYNQQIATIEENLQAELEAKGLAEQTELEQAQATLAELQANYAAATEASEKEEIKQSIALQKQEIARLKIIEAANKEKEAAELAYKKKLYQQEVKQFRADQAFQTAEVWIAAATGIVSAWSTSIAQLGPIAGSVMAGILTGVMLGVAGAQTAAIWSQSPPAASFETGGIVPGTSYSGDNVVANVNSGEMVLTRGQQTSLYERIANNDYSGGNTSVNVYIGNRQIEDIMYEIQRQAAIAR